MKELASRSGVQSEQTLRAYHREFRKVVEASDVILEVLDARDPLGCRCVQVEHAILNSGTNKKLILVLNKIGEGRGVSMGGEGVWWVKKGDGSW